MKRCLTHNMNSKLILSALASLLLQACNSEQNITELCEENVAICAEFVADSWCKSERKKILLSYKSLNTQAIDFNKYNVLIALENYKECMSFAGKIEHIKLKEKRSVRLQNTENAIKKITALSNETKNSDDPYILYYHWSRYLEKTALHKFIKLEGSQALESPELQFFLATYYTKIDDKKTLGLLYHALELYKEGDKINPELLKSLITIFTDNEEYKQAYIWLKILELYIPSDKNINKNSLPNFAQFHRLDAAFLDKVAISTLSKIQSGQFTSPKF